MYPSGSARTSLLVFVWTARMLPETRPARVEGQGGFLVDDHCYIKVTSHDGSV
jgi:hypothetical protein